VSIKFSPGEKGSGFTFKSEIKGGVVPKEYIPGVVKGLEEMMTNGALAGYPMVDLETVLYDGSYHDVDSSVLAFQIAARGAFRDAMKKGKCKLMEPIMKVDVLTPEDNMGDVIGDLNSRRGMVEGFTDRPGGMKNVEAQVLIAAHIASSPAPPSPPGSFAPFVEDDTHQVADWYCEVCSCGAQIGCGACFLLPLLGSVVHSLFWLCRAGQVTAGLMHVPLKEGYATHGCSRTSNPGLK
jgi:hypothetical protein